jgi:serine protease inhibitor
MNAAMIAGYNALGLALFRALAQSDSNFVMSPLSIGVTLAMGLAGAAGETADEMARTLAFDGADLFAANADLLRYYADSSAPEAARVRLANALVLTQHGEAVAKAYRDLLAGSFAAEIFAGDVARINQWVAQRTESKIERALDSLPPDDIAVLLNAIYFKAPWAKPFNPASTFTTPFLRGYDDDLERIEIEVEMMVGSGDHVIAGGPGYRAARLPYKTASLGMIVVLPDEESGPETVLESLDVAELTRLRAELARAEPSHIILRLPRFRARARSSMIPALEGGNGAGLRLDARRLQPHDRAAAGGDPRRRHRRRALRHDRCRGGGHRGGRRDADVLPHRRRTAELHRRPSLPVLRRGRDDRRDPVSGQDR